MKFSLCYVPLILLILCLLKQTNAASVICGNNGMEKEQKSVESSSIEKVEETTIETPKRRSEMKQLLRRVQCTLQKAEPWLDEFEQEARRIEETAKRFGEGVIRSFKGIMGKLIGNDNRASNTVSNFFNSIIGIGGNKKQSTVIIDKQQETSLPTSTLKVTTTKDSTTQIPIDIQTTILTQILPKINLTSTSTTTTTTTPPPPTTTTKSPTIQHMPIDFEDINTMDNEI